MRQRANWLIPNDARVVENLLEFACSGGAVFCSQIGLATEIGGIERKGEVLVRVSQFVRRSGGQSLDGGLGVSAVEGESRPSHRQISSLNSSVLREPLC